MNNTASVCITDVDDYLIENLPFFRNMLVFIVCVNSILAVTASFGNGLIIIAILKSSSLHKPSYMLIASMAATDFLVGFVFQPFFVADIIFHLKADVASVCFMDGLIDFIMIYLAGISCSLSLSISIDRYLALVLKQRYQAIVTKNRVKILIFIQCVGVLILPSMFIKMQSEISAIFSVMVAAAVAMIVATFAFYSRSFVVLRRQTSALIHPQQPQPASATINVPKYTKTLKTMVVISGCLVLCYGQLPLGLLWAIIINKATVILAYMSLTVFTLNASLNPVIYLIRFRDIRRASMGSIRVLRGILRCIN